MGKGGSAGIARQARTVVRNEFVHDHLQRSTVGHDVVHDHHHHMLVLCQADQPRAKQRPGGEIERRVAQALNLGERSSVPYCHRLRRQIHRPPIERHRVADHLLHLALHPGAKDRSQRLVALHQRGKAALHCGFVQRTMQPQCSADVVCRAVRVHLPKKPLAKLGIRQRSALLQRGIARQDRELAGAQTLCTDFW